MKKISVITIVYNGQDIIERTIRGVLAQTYRENFEYIVVDGASTDETLDVIKKYESDIDLIVSEPDKGIYDAMNKGVGLASGEWISFINADDTFADNDVLANVMSMVEDGDDVVYGSTDFIYEDNKLIFKDNPKPIHTIVDSMPFCHQAALIKSSLLKELRFDTTFKIIADFDSFLRAYLQGAKFRRVDLTISNFRWGGLSTTSVFSSAIETIYSILRNTSLDIARKSSIYRDLPYLCIDKPTIIALDKANREFIRQTHQLEAINNQINGLNIEIQRFYSAKAYRLIRLLSSPFYKIKKILFK